MCVHTYVQPAGSQRIPCVGRCMLGRARCVHMWSFEMTGCGLRLHLHHGPQLCSSASGPDVGQCFGEGCDKQGGTEMIRGGESLTHSLSLSLYIYLYTVLSLYICDTSSCFLVLAKLYSSFFIIHILLIALFYNSTSYKASL